MTSEFLTMQRDRHASPNHLFGSFLGLDGHPDGTVSFHFARAGEGQEPLTSADVDAVFVLVFGAQGAVYPSFTNGYFNPAWLAHTEMGKTFRITDQLLGRLSWGTKPLENEPSTAAQELAVDFHTADQEIKNCQDEQVNTRRHLVRPETVYRTWSELPGGALRCQLHEVRMRIDVAGAHDNDANQLTREYNRLAARWPVLERYRQLMGLLYAIHELRERGFCPGPILAQSIRANEVTFVNGTYAPYTPQFITASS